MRRIILAAALLLGLAAVYFLKVGRVIPDAPPVSASPTRSASVPLKKNDDGKSKAVSTAAIEDVSNSTINELNASAGTIRRDLEILHEVFATWETNFPHDGNPVGENSEITAALTGTNRLHLAFVPRNHPAINAAGELCDRWGTPFRFHQLGGFQMEIRSAGPDKKFGTADDVEFAPWPKPDGE